MVLPLFLEIPICLSRKKNAGVSDSMVWCPHRWDLNYCNIPTAEVQHLSFLSNSSNSHQGGENKYDQINYILILCFLLRIYLGKYCVMCHVSYFWKIVFDLRSIRWSPSILMYNESIFCLFISPQNQVVWGERNFLNPHSSSAPRFWKLGSLVI